MRDCILTTVDNPYNPFDNYDEWLAYDIAKGYNTNGYLARVAMVTDSLGEDMEDSMIEQAMQEIVDMHNGQIYKIVYRDSSDS